MKLLKHLNQHLDNLDNLLNIDSPYFEGMVSWIYSPEQAELQLNKFAANNSDTESPFLDLHLSISNRFVSSSGVPMIERTLKSISFLHISSARAEVIFFD